MNSHRSCHIINYFWNKDVVVLAIHIGRIHSVLEVTVGTSAESPFDATPDSAPSKFNSFKDYFNKKYGVLLKHPMQPLLQLKHSHSPHNLLMSKAKYEGSRQPTIPHEGFEPDENNLGWNWLERWIAVRPWENRFLDINVRDSEWSMRNPIHWF